MRRKTEIIALLSVLFGASMMCRGQIRIALRDVSEDGSPVRVSGTISLQDVAWHGVRFTYRTEGSVANASDRDVVLTVIHLEASGVNAPALNEDYITDRFFSPTVLRVGESQSIDLPSPAVQTKAEPEEVGPDAVPTATAEVRFVQFVDGSTWGDANPDLRWRINRRSTVNELNRLKQVVVEQGTEAFTRELSLSAAGLQFTATVALVSHCRIESISCLIDTLNLMLDAEAQHEKEMKASWDPIPIVEEGERQMIGPE